MRIFKLIHFYHLSPNAWPHSFAKIISHMRAGWRLARQHKFPFLKHIRCLNCMTTVYNFYRTLDELSLPYPSQLFDIGANRSQFAELVQPILHGGSIIAVEPNPSVEPEVFTEIYRCALSDYNGESYLNVPGGNDELGSLNKIEGGKQIKVDVRRFDSLPVAFSHPVLAKIDTEGNELNILKGFGQKINEIDYIVLEIGNSGLRLKQNNMAEIMQFLFNAGFNSMKLLHSCFDGPMSPAYIECLFWREPKHGVGN